jgi:hypothetical protein
MDEDIAIAERLDPPLRRLGQRWMPLDRLHLRRDLAEHRRRIARAGADLEHAVAGLDLGGFDHQRHDIGLRDRLALADRQRPVLIGEFLEAGLDEHLARHPPHRLEHMPVAHPAAGNLNVDHAVAGGRKVEHRGRLHSLLERPVWREVPAPVDGRHSGIYVGA